MGKSRAQFGQAEGKKDEPLLLSDDLRGWIDRVILPILVQQFIHSEGLQNEPNDG
jgi:hypothetical protein